MNVYNENRMSRIIGNIQEMLYFFSSWMIVLDVLRKDFGLFDELVIYSLMFACGSLMMDL